MKLELRKLVAVIGWITVVSGAAQLLAPAAILRPLQADSGPTAAHFFRIVGMFMVLFGGLLLHSHWRARAAIPVFWCGLQKVGAVAAVGLGVAQQLLAPLALAVAAFDLVSAVLILAHARRLQP